MSTEVKLAADVRTEHGSRACNRLRLRGLIPGNLYGHNDQPVSIVVKSEAFSPHVRAGVKVFDIEVNGKADKTLLRELQFDPFGIEITHFDLLRVDPNERVTLHVPLVIKGIAPGAVGTGGVMEQPLHTLTIDCLAYQIPDSIPVRVNTLQVGQAIHVRELELPPGIHVQNSPDAIVVHVVAVKSQEVAPAEAAAGAQPEVVGKKTEDAPKA